MNTSIHHTSLLLIAVICMAGCVQTAPAPAKAGQKNGAVPDSLNDPRPEMPGMGPLGMPMR